MVEQSLVLTECSEGVATLTLNDPATRNAISGEAMLDALTGALEHADQDETVRVIILTGAHGAFCSGGNVKDMAARRGMFDGQPQEIAQRYREGIQRLPRAFARLRTPVIAAVDGAAYGAGCDLALMCDLRLASTGARFAENFVRLGLVPGDGGAWFLPRIVGQARAMEMALTGEPVDAEQALAWGLVSRVVEPERLLEEARALAGRIAANPAWAVEMTRQLVRDAPGADLPTFLERTATIQGVAHHTPEHEEALRKLLGRDPKT